jgi:hypothetical protein
MMIGMNSFLYTFKGGNLYRHNSNEIRNNFYGVQYTSKITSVFNPDVSAVKNFKTISIDGDDSWDCTIITDLDSGFISNSWFELKEGNWFAYIRRNDMNLDLKFRSAQGIGTPTTVNSTDPLAVVITFNYGIGSIISVGDTAYKNNAGTILNLGVVTAVSASSITVNTTGGNIPLVSDFILYIKNSVAESYGSMGYYMQYELENASTDRTELFAVSSNLFKSYP